MKSATLPSLRVEPELREELEAVLHEGESLSAFMESSVRQAVRKRQLDAEFHARAKASYERVMAGEERVYTIEESVAELRRMTEAAKAKQAKHSPKSNAA